MKNKYSIYLGSQFFVDYFVPLVIILFSVVVHLSLQKPITAGEGYGWDGLEYKKIYELFSGGDTSKIAYPFCNRIGTPFLASWLSLPVFEAFKYLNLFFGAVFSFTTYLITRRLHYGLIGSFFALFLTIIPFFSPIRFVPFHPIYTDPAFLAILSLSMLAFISKGYLTAFILLVVAYLFREASVYVLLFYGVAIFLSEGYSKKLMLVIAAAIIAIVTIKLLIIWQLDCSGSQIKTAFIWARRGLSDPVRFVNYIAAILMTAAPLIFLDKLNGLGQVEKASLGGFFLAATIAFLGGSDATRIFYSFFPIYFLVIISVITTNGVLFAVFCALGYIITNRFGQQIVDPVNYWPAKDESGYFWQFPDHARPEVGLTIIVTWLIIFIIYGRIIKSNNRAMDKI